MERLSATSSQTAEPYLTAERVQAVAKSFHAAAAATGGVSVDWYRIAGAPVCLRFASPELRKRLTPAFAHLRELPERTPGPAALTVNLWDSGSTGVEPPTRPPAPAEFAPGALFHHHEPPLRAAYQPGLESLSILNGDTGEAWHWVADAAGQPYWDQASPIRQILFWWLTSRGCLQVHGAGIGTEQGGVLLVGKGGSGKSTVALSSLASELLYAGDDYVAVSLQPAPRIESLYSSGKLEPHHVNGLLPHLVPLLANGEKLADEKAVVYVHDHFPERTTSGFPLRAVLVPTVRPEQRASRIVETSRAAAFAALAPSTIFQLHTAGPDALATMSRVVERVPCFGLELGSDVSGIPTAVLDFLDGLPADRT